MKPGEKMYWKDLKRESSRKVTERLFSQGQNMVYMTEFLFQAKEILLMREKIWDWLLCSIKNIIRIRLFMSWGLSNLAIRASFLKRLIFFFRRMRVNNCISCMVG